MHGESKRPGADGTSDDELLATARDQAANPVAPPGRVAMTIEPCRALATHPSAGATWNRVVFQNGRFGCVIHAEAGNHGALK